MELWAECFGPHLILSVWGQCVSLGDHIPDVSQRISVRQAERAPEGDVGRNVEELRRPGHEGMGLGRGQRGSRRRSGMASKAGLWSGAFLYG